MRLVYLSPVPWSSFAQRPHFMVRYFLDNGCDEAVWVDPYPARLPKWTDLRRSWSLHSQGTPQEDGLKVIGPRFLPIDPLPLGYRINKYIVNPGFVASVNRLLSERDCLLGIGKPSSLAVDLVSNRNIVGSFYDAMDDFPLFHAGISRTSMQNNEDILAGSVDHIFCSSANLIDKFKSRPKITLIENAFDDKVLNFVRCKKAGKRPVIGYIGSLGEWFDWDVLRRIARHGHDCEFRLMGPRLVPVPSDLPSNLTFYPACRHDEVPRHLAEFDVGLIPFAKNQLTDSIDPVKYYDYRAMGIPILTTSFGQMKHRLSEPGVFSLDEEFGEEPLKRALDFEYDAHELESWRARNSWTARFSLLKQIFPADITP